MTAWRTKLLKQAFLYANMPHEIRSPTRYIQGVDTVDTIDEYVDSLGESAWLLSDELVFDIIGTRIKTILDAQNIPFESGVFYGECTPAEVDRHVTELSDVSSVIIGAGGGKTLDTAKAVAIETGLPMISIPTIASTDAPASSLSVFYTEEGEFDNFRVHPRHPDIVVVDTRVIAQSPVRFFRSGMADALATWFEADTAYRANAENVFGEQSTRAARAIARECFEIIDEHGTNAISAVKQDSVTPAVEYVTEANVLLSGIGFESGGLAAAHAIHDGLTTIEATHQAMHGEKVNIGTLTQLVLEGADSNKIDRFLELSLELGLPVRLGEIGLKSPGEEQLKQISEAACAPDETIHNEPFSVEPPQVRDALRTADRLGGKIRETD